MWSRRSFLAVPAGFTFSSHAAIAHAAIAQDPSRFIAETTLVLTPATITDRKRKFVRGISPEQFVLLDNGSRRSVRVEEDPQPMSLVLALHASFEARKPLDRLRKAASLFGPLVLGAGGVAGLVAFRDDVELAMPLTSQFDTVTRAIRDLVAKHSGCALLDAVQSSAAILRAQPPNRRKVIVIMTEDRDRSSKADLSETLKDLQKQNITVYALTYSPGLMQLGREVPTGPWRYASAPVWGDKDFANVFRTMSKQGKVVDVLVAATGGRRASFFRQNAAEQLILELGEELHTQYLLSFKPLPSPPTNSFRPIQVTVAGRDDLTVRTRAGYWLAASQ